MGFFDKAIAQAQQLAEKAAEKTQEGVKAGQDKLEQAQAKRTADAALRDLGAALYLERTGRGSAETAAAVASISAQLAQHEAEHGPIELRPAGVSPADEGPAVPPTPPPAPVTPTSPPAPVPPPAPPAPPAPAAGFSLDDL